MNSTDTHTHPYKYTQRKWNGEKKEINKSSFIIKIYVIIIIKFFFLDAQVMIESIEWNEMVTQAA